MLCKTLLKKMSNSGKCINHSVIRCIIYAVERYTPFNNCGKNNRIFNKLLFSVMTIWTPMLKSTVTTFVPNSCVTCPPEI